MLFLHIGLHKTGTTFLQKAVFPYWQDIVYLPHDKLEYITRMKDGVDYLLSREGLSGQNWMHSDERSQCIARLAQLFPDARIILSFRRHSGYIASSYNQYLQRGGYLQFDDYFDSVNDSGYMKAVDFVFRTKIDVVAREFRSQPFVMLHEDIIGNLPKVLCDLEAFIGGKAPPSDTIKLKKYNQSVGFYPAKLLRALNKKSRSELNPEGSWNLYHWRLRKMGLDPRSICQSSLKFLPSKPLLTVEICN